jgi:hypothetical protein
MANTLIGKKAYAKPSDAPVTIVSEPLLSGSGSVKVVIVYEDLTIDTIDVCRLTLVEPF